MYLDTGLKFQVYNNISLEKSKRVEDRVRRLGSAYGLEPGLIRPVQVAAVLAIALYVADIWWQGQSGMYEDYQKLINRQGQAVIGIFRKVLRIAVLGEAGLRQPLSLFNNRRCRYGYRLQVTPRLQPMKDILPINLKEREEQAQ